MLKGLLVLPMIVLLSSCELIEDRMFNYRGDEFSRNLSYANAEKQNANTIFYDMEKGIIELHLAGKESYAVDHRSGKPEKIMLSSLHYGKRIDNSLRYFMREGMGLKDLKCFLGYDYERLGYPATTMYVWKLADGRHLGILPSTLEVPAGMNSYNILNEGFRDSRMIRLLPYGANK